MERSYSEGKKVYKKVAAVAINQGSRKTVQKTKASHDSRKLFRIAKQERSEVSHVGGRGGEFNVVFAL